MKLATPELTEAFSPSPREPQASRQQQLEDYERCEQCESQLDEGQRYCLNCGARSRYATNPGIAYLASGGRRRTAIAERTAAPPAGPAARFTPPVVAGLI